MMTSPCVSRCQTYCGVSDSTPIPIVFITGDGDRTVRPMLLERGAVECLLKPFSAAALLDAIRAALPPPHPGG
jgi:FixJ family two-component response regulator